MKELHVLELGICSPSMNLGTEPQVVADNLHPCLIRSAGPLSNIMTNDEDATFEAERVRPKWIAEEITSLPDDATELLGGYSGLSLQK